MVFEFIEKLIASLAILVFLPVMLVAVVAIKLESSGPVIFRQKRLGLNNQMIEIFKFRSMYLEHCDPHGKNLVSKKDRRVTKVGYILRKLSIDELPQLFNVLNGTMSLVGPRPHAPLASVGDKPYHELVDNYFERHKVKPGITGWAQVNGYRGETDTIEKLQRRIEHDLYYVENKSFIFDVRILMKTPICVLSTKNAL